MVKAKDELKRVRIPPKTSPPAEFSKLQPTLMAYQKKLDALATSTDSGAKYERARTHAAITALHAKRNRYLYNLYHKRRAIEKETWRWMCRWGYVDVDLVAKWRRQGYETLCCLECIGETVCVCRVPKSVRLDKSSDGQVEGCTRCACKGCASGD